MKANDTKKVELLANYTVSQVETMIHRYEYSKAYHAKHSKKVRVLAQKAVEAGIKVTEADLN